MTNFYRNTDPPYAPGTVVRFKATGVFAIIRSASYMLDKKTLLHYLGEIEGKEAGALYYISHHDVELECLPPDERQSL